MRIVLCCNFHDPTSNIGGIGNYKSIAIGRRTIYHQKNWIGNHSEKQGESL
jgi:hypothetical protein